MPKSDMARDLCRSAADQGRVAKQLPIMVKNDFLTGIQRFLQFKVYEKS